MLVYQWKSTTSLRVNKQRSTQGLVKQILREIDYVWIYSGSEILTLQGMECGIFSVWLIRSTSWKYVRPYRTEVEKGWLKMWSSLICQSRSVLHNGGSEDGRWPVHPFPSQVQVELMKGNGEEVGGLFSNVIIEKLRLEGWPSVTIDIQQRLADHSCSDPFNGRQHCEG